MQNGEVIIVDEFTGRLMHGRRTVKVHQAIEPKKVSTCATKLSWATITFQNFFRMYNKLAGDDGTAETEAKNLRIYNLDVVVLQPT